MRALWADDVASFGGEFTRFDSVRVNPKPVRGGRIPIVLGGNGDPSLARVATFGDGWYGFNLPVNAVPERVEALAQQCKLRDRSPRNLTLAVALSDGTPADLPALAGIGVTEVVLVAAPPPDPLAAAAWLQDWPRSGTSHLARPTSPLSHPFPRAQVGVANNDREVPGRYWSGHVSQKASSALISVESHWRSAPSRISRRDIH